MKRILLINPWIYDFAAYDLWIKPWGLLKISTILKKNGFKVYFADAMDRFYSSAENPQAASEYGTGKYRSEEVEKPLILKDIPKKYKRYGMPVEYFTGILPDEDVDYVFISSGMTYWYPGVFEAIKIVKNKYPSAVVVLGGIYASLSYEHALSNSNADYIVRTNSLQSLSDIVGKNMDFSPQTILDEALDYSYYKQAAYGVLRITLGCPYRCAYCAQGEFVEKFLIKDDKKSIEEIEELSARGINNFAFYDDALLYDMDYFADYMKKIIKMEKKFKFFTPNGLHARYLKENTATLMREANFINPMLSLEIADDNKSKLWHSKVTLEELKAAIMNLRNAGYGRGEYSVYLLMGGPADDLSEIEQNIELIHSLGAKVSLSEYSPVPGTKIFGYDDRVKREPLLQNNSVFPSFPRDKWEDIKQIKKRTILLNREFSTPLTS